MLATEHKVQIIVVSSRLMVMQVSIKISIASVYGYCYFKQY